MPSRTLGEMTYLWPTNPSKQVLSEVFWAHLKELCPTPWFGLVLVEPLVYSSCGCGGRLQEGGAAYSSQLDFDGVRRRGLVGGEALVPSDGYAPCHRYKPQTQAGQPQPNCDILYKFNCGQQTQLKSGCAKLSLKTHRSVVQICYCHLLAVLTTDKQT